MVVLAPVLALPWYLNALGPKQFGLIGFIATLQALMGLLDAGMSQALVREIAIHLNTADGGRRKAAALLYGFERIYWLFALVAGAVILMLAGVIASYWLHLGDLPHELGKEAVYGAAAMFVAQFPGSLYRSLLVGAQAQVKLNGVMFGGALIRHLGGALLVTFLPLITVYIVWHAAITMLETLVRGKVAWKTLGIGRSTVGWQLHELRPTFSAVVTLSGAVWLGALTVQMDKIVLSRIVPIEQFGYYVVASSVAIGALQLIYPIIQAVMPRAVQLRPSPDNLHRLYLKLFSLIAFIVVAGTIVFVVLGKTLLELWLRNIGAVETIYPILAILLVGTALNAFYNIGYINWIVHQKIRRVVQVNALSLVLSIFLTSLFVMWFGVIGAAFGWLAINLIGCILSLEWCAQK